VKKIITATIFPLLYGTILARERTNDEAAINKQVDAILYSWNNHNYDDMKNYTTENTDRVNVVLPAPTIII
jgi:hypothetical protein